MLRFVCDSCGSVKRPQEVWITGLAAENVGTKAARREVIIDPVWTFDRAVEPFAVHFCSVECKNNYVARLFDRPAELLEIDRVTTVSGVGRTVEATKRRVKSTVPRGSVRSSAKHRRK